MYKHGHELPEFAMYPLLDNAAAVADLREMYRRYLEVVAHHDCVALMGGLDYRASPDWSARLGISRDGLVDFQLRAIEFLREVAAPFSQQISEILFVGIVGPCGDAYEADHAITAEQADEYASSSASRITNPCRKRWSRVRPPPSTHPRPRIKQHHRYRVSSKGPLGERVDRPYAHSGHPSKLTQCDVGGNVLELPRGRRQRDLIDWKFCARRPKRRWRLSRLPSFRP